MSILWALPDELMPLVIAGIGLAVILGLLRLRKAASLIGSICLLLMASPFFDALFDSLPGWLFLVMLPIIAIVVLRWLMRLVIGERATDHVIGSLIADLCRALFLLPFRMLGLMF